MKRLGIVLAGGLVVATLMSLMALWGPGRRLEWFFYDYRLQLRRRFRPRSWHTDAAPIRVITIDDASIIEIEDMYDEYEEAKQRQKGRWRWSREIHALLLQILNQAEYRPRAIGYDLAFRKPKPMYPEGDAALAYWVRTHGDVALAYHFEITDASALPDADPLPHVPPELEKMSIPTRGTADLFRPADPRVPWPELAEAGWLGFINAPRDDDGVLRRIPLVMQCGEAAVPALSLATVMRAYGCQPRDLQIVPGRWIRFTTADGRTVRIPIDRQGRALIDFPDGWESVEPTSFIRVLRWQANADTDPEARAALESFKDTVVFVGMNYSLEPDAMPTPLEDLCPGVAVHAALAHSILSGSKLRDCPAFADVAFVTLVSLGAAALATWPPVRWAGPAFALALLATFGIGLGVLCYLERAIWTFTPMLAGVLSFTGLMAFRQMVTERHRRRLRRLFSQYLSAEAVNEIVDRADHLAMGGRRMQAVVLFSDIRGFTSLTERLGAPAIVELLNDYFGAMTEVIHKHGGAVNKFVGDEIFATFGVPVPHPDDALRAVQAGIEMQERLAAMRGTWRQEHRPELVIGIGISRGEVVAGTIGSERRKDYTAIGDAVNLGARLQELTKDLAEKILVCQAVWDEVHGQVSGRPLAEVQIRGRSAPVRIYAIDVPD